MQTQTILTTHVSLRRDHKAAKVFGESWQRAMLVGFVRSKPREPCGNEVNAVVSCLRSVDACARAYFRIGLLSHLRRRPDPSAERTVSALRGGR